MKQDLDTLIQTVTGYVREEDLTVEDARRLLWECLTALEELRYGVEKAQQREPEKPNQDKENLASAEPDGIPCAYARAAAGRFCSSSETSSFKKVFLRQAKKGLRKYGHTLEEAVRKGRVTLEEIAKSYAPEEAADLAVYFEALAPLIPKAQLPAVTLAFFILLKTLKLISKRVEQKQGKSEKTKAAKRKSGDAGKN